MILKITNNSIDFDELCQKLIKFNIMYYNDTFYVSDVKCNSINTFRKKINKIFGPNAKIFEINKNNLGIEPKVAKCWCQQQLTWESIIKFEDENQKKLQEAWRALDSIEEEIFKEKE